MKNCELTERSARMTQLKFICTEIESLKNCCLSLQGNMGLIRKASRLPNDMGSISCINTANDSFNALRNLYKRLEKLERNLNSIRFDDFLELTK